MTGGSSVPRSRVGLAGVGLAGAYHHAGIILPSKLLYRINSGSTNSANGSPARPECVRRTGSLVGSNRSTVQMSELWLGPSKTIARTASSGENATSETTPRHLGSTRWLLCDLPTNRTRLDPSALV